MKSKEVKDILSKVTDGLNTILKEENIDFSVCTAIECKENSNLVQINANDDICEIQKKLSDHLIDKISQEIDKWKNKNSIFSQELIESAIKISLNKLTEKDTE